MADSDMKLLLLIPVILALVFMAWVFWRLEKQIRKERRRTGNAAPAFNETDRAAPDDSIRRARSFETAFGPPPQQIDRSSSQRRSASR